VPGIIAAARLRRKTSIIELLQEYDLEQHPLELSPRDILFCIFCLLHLLPTLNTRHKARISAVELENQLLTFTPQQTSLELFLTEKKTTSHKQPFLLCLGSQKNPSTYYLILDTKAVSLGECGILRAVDCLFKGHFVYWVDYAKPLAHFIEFLQKTVYKIDGSRLSACVRELQNSITALTENASG